jgi:hypothetical protein
VDKDVSRKSFRRSHELANPEMATERKLVNVHEVQYDEHRSIHTWERVMKTSSLQKKLVQIDQRKLNRAVRILQAGTETEALDRALSVVVSEDKIDTALRKARGKGRIRKVFR